MKNVLFLLFLFLCACRTEYVPLEVVRYDSLMIEKLLRDSVYVRDSIYVKDKGDTIYEYKDQYIYVYKNRIDTFYIERIKYRDVPVPVERELSWWEKLKLNYSEWLIGLVMGYILMRGIKEWIAKKHRKE